MAHRMAESPQSGAFQNHLANWLNDEKGKSENEEDSEIYEIILPASSVVMVEFVKAEEVQKE